MGDWLNMLTHFYDYKVKGIVHPCIFFTLEHTVVEKDV